MQYFLGLTEFNPKPLFESAMLSQFAMRFGEDGIAKINEEIYRRMRPPEEPPDDSDSSSGGEGENKGTLILDATVAPADIRYPTDLALLNECRESSEEMIESIWEHTERTGHKTAYNRTKARKGYLEIAKQRKPRRRQIRQAIREQLEYVEKNIEWVEAVLQKIGAEGYFEHWAHFQTIQEIAKQQRLHFDNPAAPVPNRIVSVRQPHVRPIVRGKARSEVEFGQKLGLSIVDGFAFIENQSWDNFSEGKTLQASAEKYRERHGVYPKAILADMTYRNRENIRFCKEHGIRLTGPKLGRPKVSEIEADREQAYKDSCDRNMVEGRIGIGKRRYGLDLIYARLETTSAVEAAMNILAMNVGHILRVLLRFFKKLAIFAASSFKSQLISSFVLLPTV